MNGREARLILNDKDGNIKVLEFIFLNNFK